MNAIFQRRPHRATLSAKLKSSLMSRFAPNANERMAALIARSQPLDAEGVAAGRLLGRQDAVQFAIDNASCMIIWVGANDGRVRYANRSFRERLGYSEDEITKLHVWDFDPDYPPSEYFNKIAALRIGQRRFFATRHKTKSGEVYPVEIISNFLSINGEEISMSFVEDVSDRRKISDELKRMDRLITTAFNTASAALMVVDIDSMKISYANPCSEQLFGFPSGAMIGIDCRNLLAEKSTAGEPALFANDTPRATTTAAPRRFDRYCRRDDGTTINVDISSSSFIDPGTGKEVGILVVVDVTESRRMESNLLEAEKIAQVGHYEYDWIKHEFHLSPGLQTLLGTTQSTLSRASYLTLLDRDRCQELADLTNDPSWTETVQDLQIVRPDDTERVLELRAFRKTDAHGRHLRRHGTLQDVTARRQIAEQLEWQAAELTRLNRGLEGMVASRTRKLRESEERLKQVMEATNDGIFDGYVTPEGYLAPIYFSPRLRSMLGLADDDNLPATTDELPIDHTDAERSRQQRLQAVQSGDRRLITSFRLLTPNGARWFKVSSLLLPAESRVRMVGAVTDITELVEARRAAEEAARVKTDFLAKMSHEIRTPLNGILGLVDLLGDTELNAKQGQYVSSITYSGELLRTILDEVLDFSRIEAGRMTIEAIAFEPRRLIGEVVTLMSGKASAKRLTLSSNADSTLPPVLIGDPTRLRQILVNLIDNAIKFTEAGDIVAAASCLGADENRATLRFSVTDSGIGIPAEKQAGLFDEFAQLDSSISRRYGGTGLGLAICRRLVELMDGSIGIQSEPGHGSRFWFELSLPVGSAAALPSRFNPNQPASLNSLQILVAEDNAINQMVVSGLLERAGCAVTMASSGSEAVKLAATRSFDLVLMDVHMPEMDGIEATRRIRALPDAVRAAVPIIALTASVTREEVDLYQRSGMNAAVAKPVRGPELLAAITRLIVSRDQAGETPLLDESLLLQRVADLGAEQTVRIMRMFPDLAANAASGMWAGLVNADRAGLAEMAHSLAGAAGMLGLQQLYHSAKALEGAAKGDDASRCAALLPSVEATLASSQAALAALAERLERSATPGQTPGPASL